VLQSFEPQLVLYDAGVDVHEHDALGRLAVTDAGVGACASARAAVLLLHSQPTAGTH
jgi:acetoin utilization deacetylase AcuC-like enzyme